MNYRRWLELTRPAGDRSHKELQDLHIEREMAKEEAEQLRDGDSGVMPPMAHDDDS